MNTPGSVAWSCIRTRSPRIAPPVNGDDGSMASTATSSVGRAQVADRAALVSVLLPEPGAPVSPTVYAVASCGRGEAPDLAGVVAAALDERQQAGERRPVAARQRGVEQLAPVATLASRRGVSATLTTSVTPSMRSRMIRSMPAFSVCVDAGHCRTRRSARR